MTNMNKKTTILITSIMLSAILLVPGTAFGEIPVGCLTGSGTVGGVVSVSPDAKDDGTVTTFATYTVVNPHVTNDILNPDDKDSCDGVINDAFITVNGAFVTGTAGCADFTGAPIPVSDEEAIQLWGPSGVFGTCEISSSLIGGLNTILGDGDVQQFNLAGSDQSFPQDASNSCSKVACSNAI